jgi:hypothetical protein
VLRVLLAAVDAQKGDIGGNPARHLAVLDQTRTQGCDLFGIAERAGQAFHITQARTTWPRPAGSCAGGRRTSCGPRRPSPPPRGLPELLDRIAAGDLPGGDEDLGV